MKATDIRRAELRAPADTRSIGPLRSARRLIAATGVAIRSHRPEDAARPAAFQRAGSPGRGARGAPFRVRGAPESVRGIGPASAQVSGRSCPR